MRAFHTLRTCAVQVELAQACHAADHVREGPQGIVAKVQDGQAVQSTQLATQHCELVEADVQKPARGHSFFVVYLTWALQAAHTGQGCVAARACSCTLLPASDPLAGGHEGVPQRT